MTSVYPLNRKSRCEKGLTWPFSPSIGNQSSESKQLTNNMRFFFSTTLADQIGLIFEINPVNRIKNRGLTLHWCIMKFWGMLFQRTLESQTCYDLTASKFALHTHKGVKGKRELPFYSGTSCLSINLWTGFQVGYRAKSFLSRPHTKLGSLRSPIFLFAPYLTWESVRRLILT